MKRAFQKDFVQPEFKKAKKLSQQKEEPEENFTYEPIVGMDMFRKPSKRKTGRFCSAS